MAMGLALQIWLQALLIAPSPVAAAAPEVRFVVSGVAALRQPAGPMQATVRVEHFVPKEASLWAVAGLGAKADAADKRTVTVSRWYHQDGNLSMSVNLRNAQTHDDGLVHARMVMTEGVARYLYTFEGRKYDRRAVYQRGTVSTAASILRHGLWANFKEGDPRFWSYYDGPPLDVLLTRSDVRVSYMGEEQCNGSRCAKVEARSATKAGLFNTFWFDVERGLVIRRIEQYYQVVGKTVLSRRADVPRLVESNGVWFAGEYHEKHYVTLDEQAVRASGDLYGGEVPLSDILTSRTTIKDGLVTLPPTETDVTMSDFVAGVSLPKEVFELEWPLETVVSDRIRMEDYRVTAVPLAPPKPGAGKETSR